MTINRLILVTGGAGFIGTNVVRMLLKRGEHVRVLDNFSTGHRENLLDILDDIELLEGDLRSIDTCHRAMEGVSHVIHQAALPSVPRSLDDPHTTHEVNATGTLHLLIAARAAGATRFVYASSSSVYGPEPKLPRSESDLPNPISPYAVSKLAGENYCSAFWHSYGLETVALRYFNVFGPRQSWDSPYAAAIPKFVRALSLGRRPTIFGDGEQSRDFTHVDNVVAANLLALEATAAPGNTYNIGAGEKTSVNSLVRMIGEAMGVVPQADHVAPRIGDVRDSLADITLASSHLGYSPTTLLTEGLPPTIVWLLQGPAR